MTTLKTAPGRWLAKWAEDKMDAAHADVVRASVEAIERLSSAPETASADRSPASGTGGSEALRLFEQRLIPARTTAGQVEAWEVYAEEWLPEWGVDPKASYGQIAQGYAAGYDDAMALVRGILNDVQTEILREKT